MAVVEAVAAATDRDVVDLPPLFDRLDTDALDALLTASRDADTAIEVRFDYDGVEIAIDGDGELTVLPSSVDAA